MTLAGLLIGGLTAITPAHADGLGGLGSTPTATVAPAPAPSPTVPAPTSLAVAGPAVAAPNACDVLAAAGLSCPRLADPLGLALATLDDCMNNYTGVCQSFLRDSQRNVQTAIAPALATLNDCLNNQYGLCQSFIRDSTRNVQNALASAQALLNATLDDCLNNPYGTCQSLIRDSERNVQAALVAAQAPINDCLTNQYGICQSFIRDSQRNVAAALATAQGIVNDCLNNYTGVCQSFLRDSQRNVQNTLATAEAPINDCLYNYTGLCQSFVRDSMTNVQKQIATVTAVVNSTVATVNTVLAQCQSGVSSDNGSACATARKTAVDTATLVVYTAGRCAQGLGIQNVATASGASVSPTSADADIAAACATVGGLVKSAVQTVTTLLAQCQAGVSYDNGSPCATARATVYGGIGTALVCTSGLTLNNGTLCATARQTVVALAGQAVAAVTGCANGSTAPCNTILATAASVVSSVNSCVNGGTAAPALSALDCGALVRTALATVGVVTATVTACVNDAVSCSSLIGSLDVVLQSVGAALSTAGVESVGGDCVNADTVCTTQIQLAPSPPGEGEDDELQQDYTSPAAQAEVAATSGIDLASKDALMAAADSGDASRLDKAVTAYAQLMDVPEAAVIDALESTTPGTEACPSNSRRSCSLPLPHSPQEWGTWCGPGASTAMLRYVGNHPSNYDGAALSQDSLAGDHYLQTKTDHASRWDKKVMHKSLNRWMYAQDDFWYIVRAHPKGPDLKSSVRSDISHNWPVASETTEIYRQRHLPGHPVNHRKAIDHWETIYGYANDGDTVLVFDPAGQSPRVSWGGDVPTTWTYGTEPMASLMGNHGIVW